LVEGEQGLVVDDPWYLAHIGTLCVIAVPELLEVSNIYGVQIANVGSPSIVRLIFRTSAMPFGQT
jgi:hypothetical protein